MKLCFLCTLIVIGFLITACGSDKGEPSFSEPSLNGYTTSAPSSYDSELVEVNPKSPDSERSDSLLQSAADTTEADGKAAQQTIWDTLDLIQENPYYVACYSFDDITADQDMPAMLLEGLSHKNPVVQWFSANKSIDCLDEMEPVEFKARLTSLLNAKEGFVRDAAGLALAALNKDWNYPHILKSPKKNRYAFTRFNDSQTNDGNVFIVKKNQLEKVNLDINTYVSGWSPDGNWLICNSIYRYGNSLQLLNVETGKIIPLSGNIIEGFSDKMPQLALNPPRGFSDMNLVEWSPDSKKVLLSYRYSDIQMCDAWMLMVNSIQNNTVDWVTTLCDEEQNNRFLVNDATAVPYTPDGFDWNAAGYGLPGGLLATVPAEEMLVQSNAAAQGFLKSISDNDLISFKSYIPSSKRHTNERIQAAMDDFQVCFGNEPVSSFKFCGLNPKMINSFKYRVQNEIRGGVYLAFTKNNDGSFTCSHPFIYYSQAVHKLADEYTKAFRQEDIKVLTRLLSVKEPVTEQRVRKMMDTYKQMLPDISNASIVFSGQAAGDSDRGLFYYELRNNMDNILSGIHINYEDGKLYLTDPMLEQIQ